MQTKDLPNWILLFAGIRIFCDCKKVQGHPDKEQETEANGIEQRKEKCLHVLSKFQLRVLVMRCVWSPGQGDGRRE